MNTGTDIHSRIQIRKWADECAAQDAEQAAYLTEWQRTHPGARRLTVSRLLAWLACVLVGITFGVIVVAEMLAPRY